MRGPHAAVLHLLERLTGVDALMLLRIAYDEYPVLRLNLVEKRLHLLGAGKTGFIQHVEMTVVWVACGLAAATSNEKTLERGGVDSGLSKLCGSSGRGN